ncbi:hypothetical protein PR202_ga20826 [Eleusine coracana subsp. coracana]|uniref:Retrotransposon Copia-like N-terminal domain-containing protein n=1 Tax=Eleusine coracana subsp. coracana TaxID=191504 RepID=A0AAV5CXL6_ELECO|nr:hypothetical protein PR202_ga20826 [Eleusine coracana subsp. coracana]
MAGILAWAADVVGGAGASDDEADDARAAASAAMTPEQRLRAAELDARAASLRRSIQDLRLRVPPPHVAQRLPHLHAHSLASSAALALQLNAHSTTKEQSTMSQLNAIVINITLDGQNYSEWSFCVETALGGYGLGLYLTDNPPAPTANNGNVAEIKQWKINDGKKIHLIEQHGMSIDDYNSAFERLSGPLLSMAQQREITLQEENTAYEKAISDCQQKIQEKQLDTSLLQKSSLKAQLENALKEQEAAQHKSSSTAPEITGNALMEAKSLINMKSKDLEKKKKELELLANKVQALEKEWSVVQEESLKNPSPAQREKVLEKQLRSLIEQLTSKQSQAEILIADVRAKEKELERLNNLNRNANEVGTARSRTSRGLFGGPEDYDANAGRRPYQSAARTEGVKRLMILRSAIVLYILLLHVIVFIKISV